MSHTENIKDICEILNNATSFYYESSMALDSEHSDAASDAADRPVKQQAKICEMQAEIDRLNKSLLFLATNETRLHRVHEKGFRVMFLDKNFQWQPACGADALFDSAEDAIEAAMKALGEVK